MGESLGGPLVGLDVEGGGDGLCDAGVKGGGSTWNHKRVFAMIACGWSFSVPVSSTRTGGEGVPE